MPKAENCKHCIYFNNNYCKTIATSVYHISVHTSYFLNSASLLNITGMKSGATKNVRIINALAFCCRHVMVINQVKHNIKVKSIIEQKAKHVE
jgi:hypothetical protein